MIGFVYLWFDRKRHKYCLGSHIGHENDGYLTSTGGNYFKNAYRKRPEDFKRRILERIDSDANMLRQAEQRWLDLIKYSELGVRYYNYKKAATGFDHETAVMMGRKYGIKPGGKEGPLGFRGLHAEKDENGKSKYAVETGRKGGRIGVITTNKILHSDKDENGKSIHAIKIGRLGAYASHPIIFAVKDEQGKSVNAVKAGRIGGIKGGPAAAKIIHAEKNNVGKSVHAIASGRASWANQDAEQRRQHALKIWESRRRNAASCVAELS